MTCEQMIDEVHRNLIEYLNRHLPKGKKAPGPALRKARQSRKPRKS